MRFDLYTSEDRASEAMDAYRSEQKGQYMAWCGWGGAVAAVAVVYSFSLLFPGLMRIEIMYNPDGSLVGRFEGMLLSVRPWGVGLVVFAILFIAGLSSAKVIAFYQGVFVAPIVGGIIWGITWIVLALIGVPDWVKFWVPTIHGSFWALSCFIVGATGGLLPDTDG